MEQFIGKIFNNEVVICSMLILKKIFSHNYWAILYFNFKMLPFNQAIKLPFDFYYKIRFENLSGSVVLNEQYLHRGIIKIGGRGSEMFERSTTIIDLKGKANFNGIVELGHGSLLRIENKGNVTLGNNVRTGAKSKIFCEEEIVLKGELDFSWECQIFDTNFHYVRNLNTNTIDAKTSPVSIGSHNFFGNRVTVMKGTITPDHFIVASNSLCNKDYTIYPIYSVFGGIPAKQIGSNKERVFENLEDVSKMDLFFNKDN